MKHTRKISIALVIMMVLMMVMAVIPASAASDETITVYFRNDWNWSTVYIHYWGGSESTSWPGKAMTKTGDTQKSDLVGGVRDIYSITIPAGSNIIFNNNSQQTPDITSGVVDGSAWTIYWDGTNNKNAYTSIDYTPPCTEHSWGSGVEKTEASCSEAGTMEYTCTACGETKTEEIAKLAHDFVGGSCTVCGIADPNACQHANKTEMNTATCTTGGQHYFDCDDCDEVFELTDVGALGHNYVDGVCSRCSMRIVYCVNGANWEEVAAYAWNNGGAGLSWPGKLMTPTGDTVNGFDVYYVELDTAYENIIFNNNNNGSQTTDLTLNPGKYYDVSSQDWYDSIDDVPEIDPCATGNFIVGAFNNWNTTSHQFRLNAEGETVGYITLSLEAGTYEFKVMIGGNWYGCDATIDTSVEKYGFSASEQNNCVLNATVTGDYVFALNGTDLSITYPNPCPDGHSYTFSEVAVVKGVPYAVYACACGETENRAIFNFEGGSIRYAEADETDCPTDAVDIRFGYTIDPNVLAWVENEANGATMTWGWTYTAGSKEGSKEGSYITDDGNTNLVFTNVSFTNLATDINVIFSVTITVGDEQGTVTDDAQTRNTVEVLEMTALDEREEFAAAAAYAKKVLYAYDDEKYVAYAPSINEEENA